MIFLYINLAVFLIDIVMFWLLAINGAHQFKLRYPGLKVRKSHWSEKLSTVLKTILTCLCPLLNLALLFNLVFRSDELLEASIEKTHRKAIENSGVEYV